MKIDKIIIKIEHDDSPDTSYLGEFTDQCEPGVIRADTWEFVRWQFGQPVDVPPRGREYRFFRPYAGGEKPGTRRYYQYGRQDAARMRGLCAGDWNYIGVVAVASVSYDVGDGSRRMETLRSGGLYGIESDSPEFIKNEVIPEQLADLRGHLEQFGITCRDVDWAALCAAALEEVRT